MSFKQTQCVFCAEFLVAEDRIASIKVLSHKVGQRYLGAHAHCLQKNVCAEGAQLVDLDDVPPGLDHFLTLP
jgi:uncharacterized protein with FMN-binding domain